MVDTTRHAYEGRQLHVPPGHAAATAGLSADAPAAGLLGGTANDLDEHPQPGEIARTRSPIERIVAGRHFAWAVA